MHVRRLDVFEGDQYERVKVKCRLLAEESVEEHGEVVEAETYVWETGMEGLEEGEWDFEEFRREKLRRWVGGVEYAGECRASFRGALRFGFARMMRGRGNHENRVLFMVMLG